MANYSAVIDLRVNGVESLKIAKDSLASLERLTKLIKPIPTLFDKRGTEEVVKAKSELSDLVKKYADGNTAAAKFATSLAGLNSQLQTFKTVAANSKVGSDEFVNSLKAGEIASQRLLKAELERLTTLKGMYTRQATGTLSAADQGPTKLVRDLLSIKKEVPNSIAGLKAYANELNYVFELVDGGTPEFRLLQKAIADVNKELNILQKGPQAGPIKPPKAAAPSKTGLQKAGVLDAILGGGFPLLFGGGPGAVLGGAAGGFAGGRMGGNAGMALSVGFSAAGAVLDEITIKFNTLIKATQTLDLGALRESTVYINQQLDTQLQTLINIGQAEKAREQVVATIQNQTGVSAKKQQELAQTANLLKYAWDQASGALGGFIAQMFGPATKGLAIILLLVGDIFKKLNEARSQGAQPDEFIPNKELEAANAALDATVDKMAKQLNLGRDNLRLEEQRTLGRTAAEKAINAELDKQQQINKINADYEQKIIDFRQQNADKSQVIVERGVSVLEGLRDQELKQLNITTSLQEQVLALDKINEQYNLQNQLIDNAQARLDIQVLEAQLAGKITEQKAQELLTTNELFAVQEKIIAAQNQLKDMRPLLTESDIALAEGKILALQKQEIKLKLTLQAQEVQRIKDEFTRSVAEGLRAPVRLVIDGQQLTASLKNAEAIIQSTLGVVNARYAAEKAINDLLIQRAEQEGDTERVYELRVRQVELTYRQTVAQIRAEVEQARIKLLQVQLEYQKFDIQMRQIMLLRQLTQEERLAWQNQYDMLQLLKEQYNLMVQAAEYRMKEADAIRQMTLEQLAYNRAKEAGSAGNTGNRISNGKTYIKEYSFPAPKPPKTFAEGGYIDKPTMAVMGEGGQSEFVIPENKMQTAMQRYAAGKRGADVIPDNATDITGGTTSSSPAPGANNIRGGASINPQINVTTGPVLELNNKRYVSQDDMVQSLRVSTDKAVEATLKLLQTNTRVRKSLGIA